MGDRSLYERLGGSAGIRAVVEDVVALHMENPVIRARFRPYLDAPEELENLKGHLCTFLEAGTGGPAAYDGRTMPDAHRGMNIGEAEYVAVTDDILTALDRHQVDAHTRQELLAIVYSLKDDIVHV